MLECLNAVKVRRSEEAKKRNSDKAEEKRVAQLVRDKAADAAAAANVTLCFLIEAVREATHSSVSDELEDYT